MIKGISEQEKQIIAEILSVYKPEYQFWAYGSRIKGNFREASDLDILIKGKKQMPFDMLEDLKHKFDESLLPYVVNFSDYYKIDEKFYLLIQPDLTEL